MKLKIFQILIFYFLQIHNAYSNNVNFNSILNENIEKLNNIKSSKINFKNLQINEFLVFFSKIDQISKHNPILYSCNTIINYSVKTLTNKEISTLKENQDLNEIKGYEKISQQIRYIDKELVNILILAKLNQHAIVMDSRNNEMKIIIKHGIENPIIKKKNDLFFIKSEKTHYINCNASLQLKIKLTPVVKNKLKSNEAINININGKIGKKNLPIGIINSILKAGKQDELNIMLSENGILISKGTEKPDSEERKIIDFIKNTKIKYKNFKILATINVN